ncbi:hypothetical protein Tco_1575922 [Tanacetum coccineum]
MRNVTVRHPTYRELHLDRDDEVKKASDTVNRDKSLLLDENDVQTKTKNSISKVAPFVEDLSQNPIKMKSKVKDEQWMEDPVHNEFDGLMYHYDKDKETVELFDELDQLLEHVAFLNDELTETIVGVDALIVDFDAIVVPVDAPVISLKEVLEMVEHVVDEDIERTRKRKKENKDGSASGNAPFRRPNKRRRLNPTEKVEKAMEEKVVEDFSFRISCLRHLSVIMVPL